MTSAGPNSQTNAVIKRARASRGSSSAAIYRMVAKILRQRHQGGGTLIDVGCGKGELWRHVEPNIVSYIGADIVRYDDFPAGERFLKINLDTGNIPLPEATGDVVVAVETIEHLENPRAFFRELTRLTKPGGLLVMTTPNQRSLLSLITLLAKGEYNDFQEAPGLYPSHITALLEIDLVRMARECGFGEIAVAYSDHGRIPFTARTWPSFLGGRWFSDNVAFSGQRLADSVDS